MALGSAQSQLVALPLRFMRESSGFSTSCIACRSFLSYHDNHEQDHVRRLHTHHPPSLTWVFRRISATDLPADVVYEFLRFLIDLDPPDASRRQLGWITSTHVCRGWRDVALGVPSFWARRVCAIPHLLDTALERAGGAPLFFVYPGRLSKTYEHRLVQAASDHIRSIHTLTLTAHSYAWPSLFAGKRLPGLRAISLQSAQLSQRDITKPHSTALHAPELHTAAFVGGSFLKLSAPALRTLTLRHQLVDISLLLDLLDHAPVLEDLVLDLDASRLCYQASTVPSARTPAALPRLRRLDIRAGRAACAFVLAMLAFPSDSITSIDIELVHRHRRLPGTHAPTDPPSLATALARPLANVTYTCLALSMAPARANANLWGSFSSRMHRFSLQPPVAARGVRLSSSSMSLVLSLLPALAPGVVRALDVSGFHEWGMAEPALRACAGLAALERICVSLADKPALARLLAAPEPEEPYAAPPFPALRTLVLRAPDTGVLAPDTAWNYVLGLLAARGDAYAPLRLVRIAHRDWNDAVGVALARTMGITVELVEEDGDALPAKGPCLSPSNSTQAIGLSADTIHEILLILVDVDPPDVTRRQLGWIASTQVCRRWRSIALGAQSVWASAPLFFEPPRRRPEWYEYHLMQAASDHIRSIRILALETDLHAWSSFLAGNRLPGVRVVKLSSPGYLPSLGDESYATALHAPELRSASFTGGPFLKLVAPALRSLTLRSQPIDINLLLDLLSHVPDLEDLVLYCDTRDLYYWAPVVPRPRAPIALPHLRHLDVRAGYAACTSVLAVLAFPLDTVINIGIDPAPAHGLLPGAHIPVNPPSLSTALAQPLANTAYTRLTLLETLPVLYPPHSEPKHWHTFALHPSASASYGVRLQVTSTPSDGKPSIADLLPALTPGAVRELDMSTFLDWGIVEPALRTCAGLAALERVCISLTDKPALSALLDAVAPPFPALRTLVLRAWNADGLAPDAAWDHVLGLLAVHGDVPALPQFVRVARRGWDDEASVAHAREMGVMVELVEADADALRVCSWTGTVFKLLDTDTPCVLEQTGGSGESVGGGDP
ncbi:hypothetical protein K488DRAFT_89343 [Vararia minispora EC-137]|uniref:Uncharacterized protein n=1 Tax=Vararia minispora EC-137 TaxID=1314806 RepID=A0ACB8QB14_9AGAM|nr:hypothetical protein K488DRAFT_89343 [Vararia minispora EC-137]